MQVISRNSFDNIRRNGIKKVYNYLVSQDKKIKLGQFYTSQAVTELMVSLSSVKKDQRVLEPSAGEGAFLKTLVDQGFKNIEAYDIDPDNCTHLKSHFPSVKTTSQDFLLTDRTTRYDLIIGNPPYVSGKNMTDDVKLFLQQDSFWQRYSNGEWDLLYAFIIWSIEKLNPEGELIYIVPYNWFNSTYAQSLRDYLIENGEFEFFAHFGEFKLFKDCYPNCIIFKYRKTQNKKQKLVWTADFAETKGDAVKIINDLKKQLPSSKETISAFEKNVGPWTFFSAKQPGANLWYLATPSQEKLIKRIESASNGILKDYFSISVGLVSGYDNAYRLTKQQANSFPANEQDAIYKLIKASSCNRYQLNKEAIYYIFADKAKTEATLQLSYPQIYNHLKAHQNELAKRHLAKSKEWWQWATVRNLELFLAHTTKDKLHIPVIDRSLHSRWSFNQSADNLPGGDVVTLLSKTNQEDMRYVLAWLNSDMINQWYRIKGSKTGKRTRYTQNYVGHIPYKAIDFNSKSEVLIYKQIIGLTDLLIEKGFEEKTHNKIQALFKELLS